MLVSKMYQEMGDGIVILGKTVLLTVAEVF